MFNDNFYLRTTLNELIINFGIDNKFTENGFIYLINSFDLFECLTTLCLNVGGNPFFDN